MLKDYEMFIKAVCLIITLTICNTNSKSLPNETIAEQVKQLSEELHKFKDSEWGCSNGCQKRKEMFKRLNETQNVKTLLELVTSDPFKNSNSILNKN